MSWLNQFAQQYPLVVTGLILAAAYFLVLHWERKAVRDREKRYRKQYPTAGKITRSWDKPE